jgi:hypothetical protein
MLSETTLSGDLPRRKQRADSLKAGWRRSVARRRRPASALAGRWFLGTLAPE